MENLNTALGSPSLSSGISPTESKLNLDISHFTEKQIYYLEQLAKFSPKQNRVKVVTKKDYSKREEAYVKENLGYLSIDQRVSYNDANDRMSTEQTNALALTGITFVSCLGYYILRAPLTRNLAKEGLKSLALGALIGYGYYRYQYSTYTEAMHGYYRAIIQKKQARRAFRDTP